MKNSMTITNNVVQQVTCSNDGTNRLFINDTEIPSTDWVGSGSYTYGSITIDQIADLSGNIQLSEIMATHYALVRTVTGSDISGDVVNTFDTYSTEYPDIEERDTVSTLFGKIKKFLADLKSKVNDIISNYLQLSGGTLSGRLTANGKVSVPTDGGSLISQKNIDKASIKVTTKAVIDGSRYDSIIGGQSTDDSTWNIGIIDNKIYIGRFASNQTANSFTASVYVDLINGYVSKANTANSATTAGSCTGNAETATNATKLNGYNSDTASTANTVVRRDANKYIKASYYNSSCSAENIGRYTSYMAFIDSNGWLRKTSQDNSKNWLGINDKVGSYASGTTWWKVSYVLQFYNSATLLAQNSSGSNYIWTVSSWSDARIKKNIKDTDVIGLEKINAIKLRQFDFKDEKRGTHKEIGYVAQELQEVVPDCVMNVPDKEFEDGLLYVEDKPLIPYLVKAIQELSAKVESLENRLKQKEGEKTS